MVLSPWDNHFLSLSQDQRLAILTSLALAARRFLRATRTGEALRFRENLVRLAVLRARFELVFRLVRDRAVACRLEVFLRV